MNPTTGEMVPLGAQGELMIRGYCVMLNTGKMMKRPRSASQKTAGTRLGKCMLHFY